MSKTKMIERHGLLKNMEELPFAAKLWTISPQQHAALKQEYSRRFNTRDRLYPRFYKYISRKF